VIGSLFLLPTFLYTAQHEIITHDLYVQWMDTGLAMLIIFRLLGFIVEVCPND